MTDRLSESLNRVGSTLRDRKKKERAEKVEAFEALPEAMQGTIREQIKVFGKPKAVEIRVGDKQWRFGNG